MDPGDKDARVACRNVAQFVGGGRILALGHLGAPGSAHGFGCVGGRG